jgi:hypothetical protein
MNKLWTTMAALSALAAAAPAVGQSWSGAGASTQARVQQLEAWLEAGLRRGTIHRSQASRLRSQAQQLRDLEARYRIGGISSRERADLEMRIDNLDSQIRYAERWGYRAEDHRWGDDDQRWDDDRRYDRDDAWDGRDDERDYDRAYDRWGRSDWDRGYRRDRSDDGRLEYDPSYNRDYDDDGEYRGGYYSGRADDRDRYREDYGRTDRGAALRVGDPAPVNFNPVPPEYRTRYRDGGGVYFGYDDGVIYEVDARTNLILRLYSLDR